MVRLETNQLYTNIDGRQALFAWRVTDLSVFVTTVQCSFADIVDLPF